MKHDSQDYQVGRLSWQVQKGSLMSDIGKRAAQAIRAMCHNEEVSYEVELRNLGIYRQTLFAWEKGKADPRADMLANMARNGYDIYYILTGESK